MHEILTRGARNSRGVKAAHQRPFPGMDGLVDGAAEQSALIDYTQIDSLLEAAGKSGVEEILAAFWKSTGDLTALLKVQIEGAGYADAAKTAHALKGSAANVGANLLSGAAKEVERCCKAGDGAGALVAFSKLDAAQEATRVALIAHLAKAA